MKNRILIFALFFALIVAMFAVCASAAGACIVEGEEQEIITNVSMPCNHDDYTVIAHGCEYIMNVDEDCVGHMLRVQCNICDLVGYVPTNVYFEYSFTSPEYECYIMVCDSCDKYICEYVMPHKYDDSVCADCGYHCEHVYYEGCNGYCVCCGAKADCEHSISTDYLSDDDHIDDYTCMKVDICTICFAQFGGENVSHSYIVNSSDKYDIYCQNCGYRCTHSKYDQINNECRICGNACDHFYDNSVCIDCGYICEHDDINNLHLQRLSYVNETTHLAYMKCDCGALKTIVEEHDYRHDCECECGAVGHDFKYTFEGDSYAHFRYKKCTACGLLELKEEFNHDIQITDYKIKYVVQNEFFHYMQYICNDCGVTFKQTSISHNFDLLGYCKTCDYRCTHSLYSDGKCKYCGILCVHSYVNTVVTESGNRYDKQVCSKCGDVLGQFLHSTQVPYFNRLTDIVTWNVKNEGASKNGKYFRQRFTISDYNNNPHHSMSINIIGGTSYMQKVTNRSYGRYAVLRFKYSAVSKLEFNIRGEKTYNDEKISTVDMVICGIDLDFVPENQWVNLVINLDEYGANKQYYDSKANYEYLRAVTCFNLSSADGYVDIDYFALAQTKAQLDCLLSYSYSDYEEGYYYVGSSKKFVQNVHSFNGDTKCDNCLWSCKHSSRVKVLYTDAECHGFDEECAFCKKLYVGESRALHVFSNNSVTCSECKYECFHNYKNGVCIYCKRLCSHGYEKESIKCIYCGLYAHDGGIVYKDGFYDLIVSIYDAQKDTFFSMLGYEILGVNIAGFIISIITLGIALWILKKVL